MAEPPADALEAVERAIGHTFQDRDLLETALTHRSFVAENDDSESYERLEFLGDAVLQLAVTDYLYRNHPDLAEGEMAKVRAAVVSEPALANLARAFHLPEALRLGRGEEMTGGRQKASILSDVVESVLGAMYLELGFDPVRDIVQRHWEDLVEERVVAPGHRDYKTRLQERVAQRGTRPVYRVESSGPEHAKNFRATVFVEGEPFGEGRGTSKKRAEQAAAADAIRRLDDDTPARRDGTDDA